MPDLKKIEIHQYAVYVQVISGQACGPIITIDANGHIHHIPDPRPLDEAGLAALKQIQAGIAHFNRAAA